MEKTYDLSALEDTAQGLKRLHDDYEHIPQRNDKYAGATGYTVVEDALNEFVENWKHNRGKQIESMKATHEALVGVIDNLRAQDADGVDQLNGQTGG